MASQNKTQSLPLRTARCGMLIALALIFSFIESLIPLSFGIPGIKLGLANLVVLSCLYLLAPGEVLLILLLRILLSGFLFGNMASILYSLCGGILSFLVMLLFRKKKIFSTIGVSILGGLFHNLGQLLCAILIVENLSLSYYFPLLMIAGICAGTFIGILSNICIPLIKKYRQT